MAQSTALFRPYEPANDHIMVGQQDGRVLMHFERPTTFEPMTGERALKLAYQLVAAARAAGIVAPGQRNLF